MTSRNDHAPSPRARGATARDSRGSRALAVATLALVGAGVLGGCAHDSDNAACRDEHNQTRTDDTRCQDNQPDVNWVHFDPGRRVPALGEPIDPAETSPFPPSSTPRGGLSTSGATAGQESSSGSSGSSSSGRSSGGYVMTPDEPEEDDDE